MENAAHVLLDDAKIFDPDLFGRAHLEIPPATRDSYDKCMFPWTGAGECLTICRY